MTHGRTFDLLLSSAAAALLVGAGASASGCDGCGTAQQARAPTVADVALAGPAVPAPNIAAGPGAESSEHVATNKPDPACRDCKAADAGPGQPPYHGKPEVVLDERTLGEIQTSIDENNDLLEKGIAILEKHAKTPESAHAELDRFLKDNAKELDRAHAKAAEIRARMKAVGYDHDIPNEIRPAFEARMGKIAERLERVRDVYKGRTEVLAAFGRLFPRPK